MLSKCKPQGAPLGGVSHDRAHYEREKLKRKEAGLAGMHDVQELTQAVVVVNGSVCAMSPLFC